MTGSPSGSGLGRSRSVVLRLSALFSLDAFAGGFIPQSLMAYWFALRFGVSPADARRDILRGEHPRRGLVAVGGTDRGAHRPDRDDGLHPPAVEHPADPRPTDADAAARGPHAVAAVQPQPDGRADAAVVRDGRRPARRAVGGGRRDRYRPDRRRGDLPVVLERAHRERGDRRDSVLPGRWPEDRLRPARSTATSGRCGRKRRWRARRARPSPGRVDRASRVATR